MEGKRFSDRSIKGFLFGGCLQVHEYVVYWDWIDRHRTGEACFQMIMLKKKTSLIIALSLTVSDGHGSDVKGRDQNSD